MIKKVCGKESEKMDSCDDDEVIFVGRNIQQPR